MRTPAGRKQFIRLSVNQTLKFPNHLRVPHFLLMSLTRLITSTGHENESEPTVNLYNLVFFFVNDYISTASLTQLETHARNSCLFLNDQF